MKGKIKWIVLAIILVVAVILTIIIINESQLQYTVEQIKEYNYFVLIEGEKYGVIDKDANVIIEPNYIAVQIPNPSKPVFICVNSYNQDSKDYETVVYNEKKEIILENYKNVQAIPVQTNIETNPYEKSVLTYKEDGKYGIISLDGKKITKPIYDEISSINYKEGSFLVKQDEKYGVVNMKGKVIINSEYETITSDNYYNETTYNKTTGFIVSKKTEEGYRYGYINYRGDIILDTEYTELERVTQIPSENDIYFIAFKNGQAGLLKNNEVILNYEYEDFEYNAQHDIFIAQRNGKKGIVTRTGETIIRPEYDKILFGGIYLNAIRDDETFIFDAKGVRIQTENISMTETDNPNYYIATDKNDIYKLVDANGRTILDDNYTYMEDLPGNYFIVARDGKNGIIDSYGNFAVELKYTSIFKFNDTNLIQAEISETKTIDLYNLQMQKVASMDGAMIAQYKESKINSQEYIMLSSNDELKYYDVQGNELEARNIFPSNMLLAQKTGDKWGFVDRAGNEVISAEYDMVTDLNEYGYAGIKKDGKWGIIDKLGNIVENPVYELDWLQPSFLGKYYRINTWAGETRYSDNLSL